MKYRLFFTPAFSSGEGIRSAAITKCVALGATLGGVAGQFLKAAAISTEKTVEIMMLTKRQIEVKMFVAVAKKFEILRHAKLEER